MRVLVSFFLVVVGFWSFAQKSTSEPIVWLSYTEKAKLSEKWRGSFNFQYRDFPDRGSFYHLYFTAGASYKLSHGFFIGAGVINLNVNRFSDTEYVLIPEIRPYQDVGLVLSMNTSKFDWRFRLEERFRKTAANGKLETGHDFNYRIRNRMRYTWLITKKVNVEISSETFLNAGKAGLNSFDQHRGTLLSTFKVGQVRLGLGYMHWLVLSAKDILENRQVGYMTVSHSFDWSR